MSFAESSSNRYQPPRLGLMLLYGLVAFIFVLFVLRFWYLQVLHGEDFSRQAMANQTRLERIYARRGVIEDDQGKLLAENTPSYMLTLTREDCPDIPGTLAQVSQWTGIPLSDLEAKYRQDAAKVRGFKPQILANDVSFATVVEIEEHLYQWPGLTIEPRQRRNYPYSSLFAHILGYVADANEKELKADTELDLGDIIGKQGLELVLEKRLRGEKGQHISDVDVLGRQLARRRQVEPESGDDVALSLDVELQYAASQALGDHAGAVVIMEPQTGKLRALVTHPSYDNNIFTSPLSKEDWNKLVNDPRHPLQNRAIQSVYPPGSVWKLMMTGLFLEQGISPGATVRCGGQVSLGRHVFRCWKRGGHGTVNMMQSLIHSCDVYYYEMAQRVGIDNIERFAKSCGFGRPTGIDLPHERSGLVPGKEWKLRRFKEPWQRGETLNTSIGQGHTLVTPVQMAVFLSALLNGGKLLKPSLLENEEVVVKGELPIPAKNRKFILDSMRVTASSGTARVVRRPDADMGGKTGTAQVVKLGATRLKTHQMAYKYRDHAWLTAFGSKEGKTYVVVVMVEHGGGGSSTAGPIVAKVYDALFGPVPGSPAYIALQKRLAEERAARERAERGEVDPAVVSTPPAATGTSGATAGAAGTAGATVAGTSAAAAASAQQSAASTVGQAPATTAPKPPRSTPARQSASQTTQATSAQTSPSLTMPGQMTSGQDTQAARTMPEQKIPVKKAPKQELPTQPAAQKKKEPQKKQSDFVDPSTLLFF